MALPGNIVVRRPGEPEMYAQTANLHERFPPGNPGWGHPPLEDEVWMTARAGVRSKAPAACSARQSCGCYPAVQWLDGAGFAHLLRSTSLYRGLDSNVRNPLLDAISGHIRAQMGDRASRRYLSVLRVGQRADRAQQQAGSRHAPPRPGAGDVQGVQIAGSQTLRFTVTRDGRSRQTGLRHTREP